MAPATSSHGLPPFHAAVVGAGTMGYGIAQLLALAGIPCQVADNSRVRAEAACLRAVEKAQAFEQAGLFPAGAAETVAANLLPAASVGEASANADLVFEAVSEDIEAKRPVYADIEQSAGTGCVIATNTSAIPIRDLAATLERPEHFLGAHWFNPPQWVPCVELIAGPYTEPSAIELVRSVLLRLGKRPVTVGDTAGFVANRIQFAMFKEAASVVADGVATAEQVDEVVRASFGFRLGAFGPFAIADMAGLDVYAGAYAALEADLGPRFAPPRSVVELVSQGRLGTKTGGGYREIAVADVALLEARRDSAYAALVRLIAEQRIWDNGHL
jgi:3-hydroxybutyryl-CoA dehydrogenase